MIFTQIWHIPLLIIIVIMINSFCIYKVIQYDYNWERVSLIWFIGITIISTILVYKTLNPFIEFYLLKRYWNLIIWKITKIEKEMIIWGKVVYLVLVIDSQNRKYKPTTMLLKEKQSIIWKEIQLYVHKIDKTKCIINTDIEKN